MMMNSNPVFRPITHYGYFKVKSEMDEMESVLTGSNFVINFNH